MTRAITNKYFAGYKQCIAEVNRLPLHYLSFPFSSGKPGSITRVVTFCQTGKQKIQFLEVPFLVFFISQLYKCNSAVVKLPAAAQLWNESPISEGAVWEQTDVLPQIRGWEEKQNHNNHPSKKKERTEGNLKC